MTRFATTAEGIALALPWTAPLGARVGDCYRVDLHALIDPGAGGAQLRFPAADVQFRFQARRLDALVESGIALVASHPPGVRVDLDPILPLHSVTVAHQTQLGVFRRDGQALAAAATTLLRPAPERPSKPGHDRRPLQGKSDTPALPSKPSSHRELVPDQAFTGAAFVLSPPAGTLALADLLGLHLDAAVMGPRLGLAVADQPDQIDFFWRGQGAGSAQASRELAEAANRIALAHDGAGPLHLLLVIAADSPCAVVVERLELTCALAVPLFATVEKQVVRFEGRQREQRQLVLPPRPAGRIAAAALLLDAQLTGLAGTPTPWPAGLKTGLLVDATAWTATAVTGPGALVHGLQLGLRAELLPARLEVVLREDHAGTPGGRVLTLFTLDLATAPNDWWNAPLPEPLMLEAKPLWLALRAASGQVTWLLTEGEGPTGRFAAEGGAAPRARMSLANQRALFAWQYGDVAEAPIHELTLNGQVLTPTPDGKDRYRYDLAPGLSATGAEATLALSTSAKGKLTLYYDFVRLVGQALRRPATS